MVLVDAVVAEVDARVVEAVAVRRILDGGEADQAVTVEVDD